MINYLLKVLEMEPKKIGITANQKTVLIALANRCDKNGKCFPSHERIFKDTGLSERTIIRCIKKLKDINLISVRERFLSDGPKIQTSNEYTMTFCLTKDDTKTDKTFIKKSFVSQSDTPRFHKNLTNIAG